VVERDALGADAQSFPLPRLDDLPGSTAVALDLVGDDIAVLLAGYHDTLPGRIAVIHPDGQSDVLLSPGADEEAVAMHQGLLVMQEGSDLVATSVMDRRAGLNPAGDLRKVRDLVRGHGRVVLGGCQRWDFTFDDFATVPLTAIPNWQRHLAALVFNPDPKTRDGALAAAVRLKSQTVARVLMSVLADEDASAADPRSPHSPRRRFSFDSRDDTAYLRTLAVMALVSMSYDEAAPVLAKHAQRTPLPGYNHGSSCSPELAAICDFLKQSKSPGARQAIVDFDKASGAEGSFKALCERRLY
jgi:hypothetical protein